MPTAYANSTSGNNYTIQATGSNSRINLSSLTSFAGTNSGAYPYGGSTSVTASGGGEVDLAGAVSGNTVTPTVTPASLFARS